MRLEKVAAEDFGNIFISKKAGVVQDLVERFCDSDESVMEIVYASGEYVSSSSCESSFNNAIKRLRLQNSMKCIIRKGKVYLIKIDKFKNAKK